MSLRVKVFMPLLLAIILLAAYIYALWIPRVLAAEENAYQNSVRRHLDSVAEGLVPLMLGKQLDAAHGNLDALLGKNADWMSIRMFDSKGRLLYPFAPSGFSRGDAGHGVRTLTQEIRYLDEKLGAIELTVDFTPQLNEIRKSSMALVYTFLAVLLLLLLATGLILDFIVRKPIRQLADASQRLANGDFEMSLPKPGNDEVGILVESFAGMRDAVRTHTERLSEANEQLLREVGERKQAEEALRRTQEELVRKEKLSILGQLSGSVGHELRNPLGVMSNAVYFLKMVQGDGDETVKEYLGIIEHEIDNSKRIITDLLDFARTKPPQLQAAAIGDLVKQSLARCAIPGNVAVSINSMETLPNLSVDPHQMGQVLENLISNGIQAMPDGGALSISARLVGTPPCGCPDAGGDDAGGDDAGGHMGPPLRDFIEISVADTGEGIAPENMKKLFQPLFTTKPKGIGLGLVVCRNLTEANGGRIGVDSRVGEGTIFTLILPVESGGAF